MISATQRAFNRKCISRPIERYAILASLLQNESLPGGIGGIGKCVNCCELCTLQPLDCGWHVRGGYGPAVQVPLRLVAFHVAQFLQLFGGLHALGHGFHAECARQRYHGGDQRRDIGGVDDALHERLVDLERVHG